MIPLEYMTPPPPPIVRHRLRVKDAARHARLGLLAADAAYRAGDTDARTSREDFRTALAALPVRTRR